MSNASPPSSIAELLEIVQQKKNLQSGRVAGQGEKLRRLLDLGSVYLSQTALPSRVSHLAGAVAGLQLRFVSQRLDGLGNLVGGDRLGSVGDDRGSLLERGLHPFDADYCILL